MKMKEKVKKWCEEEGIFKEEIEDKNLDFNLGIMFPDENHLLNIIKPKERDCIIVVSRVMISSKDQELLKEKREKFLWDLRFTLGNRPTNFSLNVENGILQDFTITYRIYEDGLTKHNFMQAIREVHKSKLLAIWKMMYALR